MFADKKEDAETCGKRHQGDEVALEPSSLYVWLNTNQLLLSPVLPCSLLTPDYLEQLLSMSASSADWNALFAEIPKVADGVGGAIDSNDLDDYRESLGRPLKTPRRGRQTAKDCCPVSGIMAGQSLVVLHALLKTHDRMSEFITHEIKNHPTVSTEYVKFLACHTPVGQGRKLLTKAVEEAAALARSAQSEAKKAKFSLPCSAFGSTIRSTQAGRLLSMVAVLVP